MKVLLVSTYELGHQPLGLAGPAAALAAAGHAVETVDLAVEPWPAATIGSVEAVAFSVPMHTASELALEAAARIRAERPALPFAFHGLYAGTIAGHPILDDGDLLASGEALAPLLAWLDTPDASQVTVSRDIGPAALPAGPPPDRRRGAGLDRYARLLPRGTASASVEASRGCNHRCRHCPVASLYGGRSRAVPLATVRADFDELVSLGATHVSFADPDFLNRPRHALEVAEALAESHPGVSFDATIKVEHVLRHRELFGRLAELGLAFVVSAFESTDDAVLAVLDKGHSAADELEAVAILRSAGIEPRPSWLPFTPWTTMESIAGLLELSARADLVANTDLVQYSIRLLLPRGSLLLDQPDPALAASLTDDPSTRELRHLAVSWRHHDKRIEQLQQAFAGVAEATGEIGEGFSAMWEIARAAGAPLPESPPSPDPVLASAIAPADRPRLSESWFCCAEPTRDQLQLVRS